MKFVSQKAIEGQVIAYFLADQPVFENSKLYEAIPEETVETNTTSGNGVWQLFFDSTIRMGPNGKVIAWVG